MGPTLFEVLTITGLPLFGEIITLLTEPTCTPKSTTVASCGPFVTIYSKVTDTVTDTKHRFLTYWLFAHVICPMFSGVSKAYVKLAC